MRPPRHVGLAEVAGAVAHLGQHRHRHAEDAADFLRPGLGMDVEQHRSAGIRGVGRVHPASGQLPDQPAVDSAEQHLAALGPGPQPLDVVEQPAQLGPREIGVDQEPGRGGDDRLMSGLVQLRAEFRGPPVLPDDRAVDRLSGRAVPDHNRLALVGDADRGNRRRSAAGEGVAADRDHAVPDLAGVMLDPARGGVMLDEFPLRHGGDPHVAVEQDCPARRGALVDREYMPGHPILPSNTPRADQAGPPAVLSSAVSPQRKAQGISSFPRT